MVFATAPISPKKNGRGYRSNSSGDSIPNYFLPLGKISILSPEHPQDRGITLFAHADYAEAIANLQRSGADNEVACLYLAAAHAWLDRLDEAQAQIGRLHAMNPGANIDWLKVAYPTRCYQDSEVRRRFFDGLARAGL